MRELAKRAAAARDRAAEVKKQARQIQAVARLLLHAQEDREHVVCCSWCGRVSVGDEWLNLAEVGSGRQRLLPSLRTRTTHGMCPTCAPRWLYEERV